MSNKNNFIRFCGELVFDPENCRWDSLSPEQKNGYCILAQKTGMQDLFVRFLQKRLPEAYYNSFRRSYQKASYICLIENHRLSELYHFFETEKIPFIPIKGADLAFRVYPD